MSPPLPAAKAKPRQFYENLYQTTPEPWNYKNRAIEIVRHDTIIGVLKSIRGKYSKILDIGCSLGQLTQKIAGLGSAIYAFDVSLLAVQKAKSLCIAGDSFHFFLARLPGVPMQTGQFDLIIASDCVHEFVPEEERIIAVREIGNLLSPEGVALFCDYMRPGSAEGFCELIRQSGLKIVRIDRMYDRVWYQFESWFKVVRGAALVKMILSSVCIAKILRYPAMLLGKYGSTHVLIVAEKLRSAHG